MPGMPDEPARGDRGERCTRSLSTERIGNRKGKDKTKDKNYTTLAALNTSSVIKGGAQRGPSS